MPLHLKPTPSERARRQAHKAARRAEKKRKGPSHRSENEEEMNFTERMWSALEDDERLDGISTRFNDYAHIPDRWARDAHDVADPQYMDDDEYAEWIREGMWKKKHAREYEEQAKRDAELAAQRAYEKHIRAETSRIEKLAREQEERRAKERKKQKEEAARELYEQRWKTLLDPRTQGGAPLTLGDIPWPLFSTRRESSHNLPIRVEDITTEAVIAFLLPDIDAVGATAKNEGVSRQNRDKLKETLLRFHPDKFEGRFMHRIPATEVESVRDAAGQVARVLNALMNAKSS